MNPDGFREFEIPSWTPDHSEPPLQPPASGDVKVRRLPVSFDQASSSEFTNNGAFNSRAGQVSKFESLLVKILTRFVNLPAEDVDTEIEGALYRTCAFLRLERAQLWSSSGKDSESFRLTHQCLPFEVGVALDPNGRLCGQAEPVVPTFNKPVPLGTESKAYLPWFTARARLGKAVIFSRLDELPPEAAPDRDVLRRHGTRAGAVIPFLVDGIVIGVLSFDMLSNEQVWSEPLVTRMKLMAEVFANAMARKQALAERQLAEAALVKSYAEIKELKHRLQVESDYLKSELKVSQPHGHITGRSQGLKRVLHQVEQVAPADCSVLITGETGTGKELIAQEIHHLSPRKDRIMVLVNCAALPTALVESELFGRERGAYTGALSSQVGRFEIANGSTIFLDEVGELSMEVQAKLLRVLQQGEFQRLGSPKTHKVDVRVITATNRDLVEEVRKGRFREDLYYRLKVFPIDVPPLRERVEDIPLLVFAFMEEFSSRMGKKITKIPRKAMETLQAHAWQGNIRELRNIIEHSVILSTGDTLKLTSLCEGPIRDAQPITLAQAERDHILKTLDSTGWRIKGPHGAAARLDLQPSTLYSRMQKLGIPHRRQKDEMTHGCRPAELGAEPIKP